jgi:hypothetical protein
VPVVKIDNAQGMRRLPDKPVDPAIKLQPPGNPQKLQVTIHDSLGPGQVEEHVTVVLNGVTKTIHLTPQQRQATLVFTLPGPGQYKAEIRCETTFKNQLGVYTDKAAKVIPIQVVANQDYTLVVPAGAVNIQAFDLAR